MKIKIITINCIDATNELEDLNRFLASNKVLDIKRKFYTTSEDAYWSFCIRYIESKALMNEQFSKKNKIDYKTVLSEDQFVVFSKLREFRKIIAQEEGVPAYAVFIDEELSEMAKLSELTPSTIINISGIGEKKLEKYGNKLVEMYLNYRSL